MGKSSGAYELNQEFALELSIPFNLIEHNIYGKHYLEHNYITILITWFKMLEHKSNSTNLLQEYSVFWVISLLFYKTLIFADNICCFS